MSVKEQVTRGAVGFDSSRNKTVVVEHVFNDGALIVSKDVEWASDDSLVGRDCELISTGEFTSSGNEFGTEYAVEPVLRPTDDSVMRGTFGFVRHEMYGKQCLTRAVVDHVFGDGRLLALLMINSNTPGEVISPEDFAPSRQAYVSFGSYVEPKWDRDSCRCTNVWAEGNINTHPTPNQPENIKTDAEVWESFGFKEEK